MPKNTNKTGGKTNMCMSSCIDFPTALTAVPKSRCTNWTI